jgi:hypothetical protein
MSASDLKESSFSLPSNMTVRNITSAHQDLLQFIDGNEATTLVLATDLQADISAIQLLEAARIYASTGGKSVSLTEPATGVLLDTLRRSGFLKGMSREDAQFWLHQEEIQ